ncbi:MAG: hypothetical protein ACRCWD_04395 [Culicoidibacterales bacterium]
MREFVVTNAFQLTEQEQQEGFITGKKVWHNIQMTRKTARKFEKDKVFYENENCIILLEGVVFNSIALKTQYQTDDFAEALVAMYQKSPLFFETLDGSFSGYLFDKQQNKLIVFVNRIGDHPVFYWQNQGKYIVATNLKAITEILQANDISYQLDEIGSYCLLTHGWMLQDITLIQNIRRINPGNYLIEENDGLMCYQYHEFSNQVTCLETTETEIITKIDQLFKKALQKQIDKNNEYGYQHVAQLSAGLDSRTVNYGLADLGVKNVLSVSYSESGYYDQVIPMKIAEELKHHWLFKSLDNGLSLFLLDEMVQLNDGLVLHYGPAQVWDMFSKLDRERIGIVYNGIAGEVIAGYYFTENNPNRPGLLEEWATSKKLIPNLQQALTKQNYQIDFKANLEMFLYYHRCFTGSTLGTPLTLQYDCESCSPFCDDEFFAYCLSIPLEYRWGFNLYDKWVMQAYPGAANYLHNGSRKLGESNNVKVMGYTTNLRSLPKKSLDKLLRTVHLQKKKIDTKHHMNPIDYWYHTNSEVSQFMDNYFQRELNRLAPYPDIQKNCQYLYTQGNATEKTQVLTLLAAMKHLFNVQIALE